MPQRIDPGRYRSMVAELFANAGRLGARQLGFMRRALTELYFEAGVLTGDPKLQNGSLGYLQDDREGAVRARNARPYSWDVVV